MLNETFNLIGTGTTGNVTGNAFTVPADAQAIGVQFVVEAAGATPTVTFAFQVSQDGTNWVAAPTVGEANNTVAASTSVQTAVGAVRQFVDLNSGARFYRFMRAVTSANTNVTFRVEAYLRHYG